MEEIEHHHCTKCDTTKDITEFYDYRQHQGIIVMPCKGCKAETQREKIRLEKSLEFSDSIKLLRKTTKSKRAGTLLRLVRKNPKITGLELRTIIREVEI